MTVLLIAAGALFVYWLAVALMFAGETIARSYGGSWSDVMVEIRRGLIDAIPRRHRQGARVYDLLRRSAYTGRVAIRARITWRATRRGEIPLAVTEVAGVGFALVFGPLACAVENMLCYPVARSVLAWCDYVEARHVVRRSMLQSAVIVAYTFPRLVSVAEALPTARELWRLRRAHATTRPKWGDARASYRAAQRRKRQAASVISDDATPLPSPRVNAHLN